MQVAKLQEELDATKEVLRQAQVGSDGLEIQLRFDECSVEIENHPLNTHVSDPVEMETGIQCDELVFSTLFPNHVNPRVGLADGLAHFEFQTEQVR